MNHTIGDIKQRKFGYESLYELREIDNIQEAILKFGVSIEYRKAMRCPCGAEERGEAKYYCAVCRGDGWIWGDPLTDADGNLIRALVSNRVSQKSWEEFGAWPTGTAFCTLPAGITPAAMDKIIPVDDRIIVNDEFLRFGEMFPDDTSAEILRYQNVLKIEAIQSLNGAYYQGKHFKLIGNRIEWIIKLDYLEAYSLRYEAIPEYLILKEQPQLRVDRIAEKPFFVRLMLLGKEKPSSGNQWQQ